MTNEESQLLCDESFEQMNVAILHPDLGIGGAERLIVDIAQGLSTKGASVTLFTSHFNPERCFEEAKNGDFPVKVHGDRIPRHINGKFHILFALLRSIWLALCVAFSWDKYDLFVCDQISMYILILKLFRPRTKVLFYCHFPDQLLVVDRESSFLKQVYRAPFDLLEELTTALADEIVVNSRFTRKYFTETFQVYDYLGGSDPGILYPCVSMKMTGDSAVSPQSSPKTLILSINRYERKKNLPLLLHSFAELLQTQDSHTGEMDTNTHLDNIHLVVAGGYDPRVQENVEHFEELVLLAWSLGLCGVPGTAPNPDIRNVLSRANTDPTRFRDMVIPQWPVSTTDTTAGPRIHSFPKITFLRSFTDQEKNILLRASSVLAYTPENEHFGIVPLEGMLAGTPVVALASGGPLETVVDGETGLLCENTPRAFATALRQLLSPSVSKKMGKAGRKTVIENFSFQAFTDALTLTVTRTLEKSESALPTRGKVVVWMYLAFTFLSPLLGLLGAIVYAMKKRKPSL